jgi:hypothetical protein
LEGTWSPLGGRLSGTWRVGVNPSYSLTAKGLQRF